MTRRSVTVVGAGNGGSALAAHLGLLGYDVKVLNRSLPRIEAVRKHGGIKVTGAVEGFGPVSLATLDPRQAMQGSRFIMVVVPATAHRSIARSIAPHLMDGQVVVLHPGRTGGALEFAAVLRSEGCRARIMLAEAQTLLYACRVTAPGVVSVKGIKHRVPVAALPARDTQTVIDVLSEVFPQYVPAKNVLETSLMNMGAVFHPAITLLNAARVDSRESFKFYSHGVTPAVARVVAGVDKERVSLAERLGLKVIRAADWLKEAYGGEGDDLFRLMNENEVYQQIDAPKSLDVRYLWEDVPTGLVPLASLGDLAGIPMPGSRSLAKMAGLLLGHDLWKEGRTADNLGITGMGLEHLMEYVEEGAKTSG